MSMEVELLSSESSTVVSLSGDNSEKDRVRVKRKTLQAVLEQCQRVLESINTTNCFDDGDEDDTDGENVKDSSGCVVDGEDRDREEAEELCDLLKSRVECPDFVAKIECARSLIPEIIAEDGNSWDVVSDDDLWENDDEDLNDDEYVLVREEDIVEGIACFMAAYLMSLKQTKELTPNQLKEALSKTFSVKKRKGKLRKVWDGSSLIYNVASWGATAIGIYQNPVIIRVATKAFCTSCHVISKLL